MNISYDFRVIGGMLLVSGSCIGAGMLALPILTGLCGFFPSLLIFFLAWGFMTYTALLLLEVNGWFHKRTNIISMAAKTVGWWGQVSSWFLYLFLFYSLLIAYTAGSGMIFSQILPATWTQDIAHDVASISFVVLLGIIVYFGTRTVDRINRVFMVGLIVSYVAMIFSGVFWVQSDYFLHVEWKYFFVPLPVLITSFGFHNMIPSLMTYLQQDIQKMRKAILGGSVISLAIYLIWEILVIGVVPFQGEAGLLSSYQQGKEATFALNHVLHHSFLNIFAQGFAFFAIITSFLAQSLSLMHFIADGLKVQLTSKNKLWLILVTLLPPLFFGVIYPDIFFKALGFAGGFCAVLLFGILPIIMVWLGRYRYNFSSPYRVKGGKYALVGLAVMSVWILMQELFKMV